MSNQITLTPRTSLHPSPLNPRKHFDEGYLDELGATLRGPVGILNPLIVRRVKDKLEIVCGECRWRASGERKPAEGAVLPPIAELPVVVREISDALAREMMLVENMKRRDLTPVEECNAFAAQLAEVGPDGKPLYTTRGLAQKIGVAVSVLMDRLALRKLSKEALAALDAGKVEYRVMRAVSRAPVPLIANLCDVVLNPRKYPSYRYGEDLNDPITAAEIEALIDEESEPLDRAPFALDDAALMPVKTAADGERLEGGACVGCPFNTATGEPQKGHGGHRSARCLNATCYKRKVEIHVAAALVKLKADGATILKAKEGEKILRGGYTGRLNASYVDLDEVINDDERAVGAKGKKKWEDVVVDKEGKPVVPVLVAVDGNGRVHRLAERKVVNAASEKLGTAKLLNLKAGRGQSAQEEDAKAREKKAKEEEAERLKLRSATARLLLEALAAAVEEKGVANDLWPHLVGMAARHAGHAGCSIVGKRRGIDTKGDVCKAVEKLGASLKGSAQMGLIMELMISQDVAGGCGSYSSGALTPDYAKPLLKYYGVEEKAVAAKAKAGLAEKKKPEAGKKDAEKKTAKKNAAAENADAGPWLKWRDLLPSHKTTVNAAMKGLTPGQIEAKEYRFNAAGKIVDSRDGKVVTK